MSKLAKCGQNLLRGFTGLALALGISLAAAVPAFAAEQRVFDEYNVIADGNEAALNAKLNEISDKHDFDLAVATVNSIDGKEPELFAADFYEEKGFGADGAILILSMRYRDWGFATCGKGMDAFSIDAQRHLSDIFLPDFGDNEYYDGFMAWADEVDRMLEMAEAGQPWNQAAEDKARAAEDKSRNTVIGYLGFTVLGLVVSLGVTLFWRSKLKSVRPQSSADRYTPKSGFQVTAQDDEFLHRSVTRTPIPKQSDSGGFSGGGSFSSSSGGSFSGSSGKF